MQKLQLYISSERIDLFKDEQVSFNQSIQNIKDPAKIFTEFTQTFTVPASPNNNKIFKNWYNADVDNGFTWYDHYNESWYFMTYDFQLVDIFKDTNNHPLRETILKDFNNLETRLKKIIALQREA